MIRRLVVFAWTSAWLWAADDPVDLLRQARGAVQRSDFKETVRLTHEANAVWAKESPNLLDYANSLVLEASALLAEHHVGRKWETESAGLVERAVEIADANLPAGSSVLALALELQSLEPSQKDRADTLRQRANDVHQTLVTLILPAREGDEVIDEHAPGLKVPSMIGFPAQPALTFAAEIVKVRGSLKMSLIVERDGTVSTGKLIHGLGWGLDEAAARAIKQWSFRPGTVAGKPVRVRADVDVSFKPL